MCLARAGLRPQCCRLECPQQALRHEGAHFGSGGGRKLRSGLCHSGDYVAVPILGGNSHVEVTQVEFGRNCGFQGILASSNSGAPEGLESSCGVPRGQWGERDKQRERDREREQESRGRREGEGEEEDYQKRQRILLSFV